MLKLFIFMSLFLSFSAFASGADDAFQKESKICRDYNHGTDYSGGHCKFSKDKQTILILAPKLTTACTSGRDLVWVLAELNAENETEFRSTVFCGLNLGPLNPPQLDYNVYSFGEMEDGKFWMAYREVLLRGDSSIRNPFKIVKFSPNGKKLYEKDLKLIHELESYPYYGGLFEYRFKHNVPHFTYLESSKEFLVFRKEYDSNSCFFDMDFKRRFCMVSSLPRTPGMYRYGKWNVSFSVNGDRAIYTFYDSNYVGNDTDNYHFGVFDLNTGKSIYLYPGDKLAYGKARFIGGSDQYIYFQGVNKKIGNGTVAYGVDIVSGDIIPLK